MRLRSFPFALLLVLLVGCVPGPAVTPEAATPSPAESPSDSPAPLEPSASLEPSIEPAASPTLEPSIPVETIDPSASESPGSGAAAACSGSDQNREFFEAAAAALDWPVYCAVLPAGWFVDSGEYRTAGGGRLEIAYRGPAGARLELHEGAFCTDAGSCFPSGIETGTAPFGDQSGKLIATDDGGWALIVERDATIGWLAVGTGLDEAAFRSITAALAIVDG